MTAVITISLLNLRLNCLECGVVATAASSARKYRTLVVSRPGEVPAHLALTRTRRDDTLAATFPMTSLTCHSRAPCCDVRDRSRNAGSRSPFKMSPYAVQPCHVNESEVSDCPSPQVRSGCQTRAIKSDLTELTTRLVAAQNLLSSARK